MLGQKKDAAGQVVKPKTMHEMYKVSKAMQNVHHSMVAWASMPSHTLPTVRHDWGNAQHELHPGWAELFLDLIFVGAAYHVGVVLKAAFYSCTPDGASGSGSGSGSGSMGSGGSGDASGSSSSSGSSSGSSGSGDYSSGSSGRRLGAAAAYDPCIGLGLGVLHALAPFLCMYTLWCVETLHKSRFMVRSKVHALLDLVGYLLLIVTAQQMLPCAAYRTELRTGDAETDNFQMARILGPLLIGAAIWQLRALELALSSASECARRQSSSDLVSGLGVLSLWGAALGLVVARWDDPDDNAAAADVAAGLMWAGNLWKQWRDFQRPCCELALRGPHLPIRRSMVPTNTGFVHHRNNEFMFLMLGETLLQLVVATTDRSMTGDTMANEVTVTTVMGFALAVAMMYSFMHMSLGQLTSYEQTNEDVLDEINEEQTSQQRRDAKRKHSAELAQLGFDVGAYAALAQHDEALRLGDVVGPTELLAAERMMLTGRMYNSLGTFLWQTKACGVMLVGVGVKLAIYNPTQDPRHYNAAAQRLEIAIAASLCFSVQLFHTVFVKTRHHYSCAALGAHPAHCAVVLARLGLLVGNVLGVARVAVEPWIFVTIQACLAVVQCVLLHVQEHSCKITSKRRHPMATMPHALRTLRHSYHFGVARSDIEGQQLRAKLDVAKKAIAEVPDPRLTSLAALADEPSAPPESNGGGSSGAKGEGSGRDRSPIPEPSRKPAPGAVIAAQSGAGVGGTVVGSPRHTPRNTASRNTASLDSTLEGPSDGSTQLVC